MARHQISPPYGQGLMYLFDLLKFIDHIPDHLSELSCALKRFFATTFLETAI